MTRLSWLQRLYWRYLSKPANERDLFLHVLENPVGSILEIGIGSGERAKRLLPLCVKPEGVSQIRYVGVDPFESAPAGQAHLNLKQAHRMLAELGVKAHLIPGEPQSAISRVANMVHPSDLIVIDGHWSSETDAGRAIQTWLPRLCHSQTQIFATSAQGDVFAKRTAPELSASQTIQQRAA